MITLTVHRDNGQVLSFELKGHADSGPYGYDLVCAAVSAVTFGALNAIEALTDTSLGIEQASSGGYLKASCQAEEATHAQLLLEGMLIALRTIEDSYGEHIKIID